MDSSLSTVITTEAIKKICVKLGFYRNPICNEKLYLHHKGFDSIDKDAFDPYTDVKVLWLEGNAFSYIPCGKDSIPCQEILQKSDIQENELISFTKKDHLKSAQPERIMNLHVDCCADWVTASTDATTHVEGKKTDSTGNIPNTSIDLSAVTAKEAKENMPISTDTKISTNEGTKKDVFQSLYPTLRQLFLHNNALREMPDLSGFQRLDTVNLSCNCIHSVRANCPSFTEKEAKYREMLEKIKCDCSNNSRSMQREHCVLGEEETTGGKEQLHCSHEGNDEDINSVGKKEIVLPLETTNTTNTVSCREFKDDILHLEDLEMWRQHLNKYAEFCSHESLEITENTKLSEDVPPEHRNPCSSIRTLNLSNNYLAKATDIVELLCFKNLSALDLSYNQLNDGEAVLLILERLTRLRSLKLSGNPLVRSLPRYRKRVLVCCQGLLHLDDRPVFADERRLVTAWARGGDEEENKEKMLIMMELENQQIRRLEEFREMVNRFGHSRCSDNNNTNGNDNHTSSDIENNSSPTAQRERDNRHVNSGGNDDDDVTSSDSEEEEKRENNGDTNKNSQGISSHQTLQAAVHVVPDKHAESQMSSDKILFNTRDTQQEEQQKRKRLENDDEEDADIYIPST